MTQDELLEDALSVLVTRSCKRASGQDAWRARLVQITANLKLQDSMAAELRMPRAERRKELVNIIDRLGVRARRGGAWGNKRVTVSPATAADIRIGWPRFSGRLLNCNRPGVAPAVVTRLRRVLAKLDQNYYGVKRGRDGDLALQIAAAAILDLLNDADGRPEGTPHSTSRDGAWHRILCRVAEAAGRAVPTASTGRRLDKDDVELGGEDRTHVLEIVRDDVLGRERKRHRL